MREAGKLRGEKMIATKRSWQKKGRWESIRESRFNR